jgi:hypothetical protein
MQAARELKALEGKGRGRGEIDVTAEIDHPAAGGTEAIRVGLDRSQRQAQPFLLRSS